MNRREIIKKGSAAALALTLALSAMILPQVRAATAINMDAECTVSFELDTTGAGSFSELEALEIPITLYQVAMVNEYGEYTANTGFESLGLDAISSETTAADWEQKAAAAMDILESDLAPQIETKYTTSIPAGADVSEDKKVDMGMYLVVAGEVQSAYYTYSFTPYLLAVPNNYYYDNGSDDWIYDITSGLKPEQTERYGDLVINKTLSSYNATIGDASFVFQVEAKGLNGDTVYSDVVSLVFDAAGTKSVTIENIPAGAQVTVTEVYSGASYSLTADTAQTQQVQIVADGEEGAPVSVSFENEYNESLNGGSSVENHFNYTEPADPADTGTWSWEQRIDSTDSGAAAQE